MAIPPVATQTKQPLLTAESMSNLETQLCKAMTHLTKMVIATQRFEQNVSRLRAAQEKDKLSRHHYDQFPHLRDQNAEALHEATSNCDQSKARLDKLTRDMSPVAHGIAGTVSASKLEAAVQREEFEEHLIEFKMLTARYSDLEGSLRATRAENAVLRAKVEEVEKTANEGQSLPKTLQEDVSHHSSVLSELRESTTRSNQSRQNQTNELLQLKGDLANYKKTLEEFMQKNHHIAQELKASILTNLQAFQRDQNDAIAQMREVQTAMQNRVAALELSSKDLTTRLDEARAGLSLLQKEFDNVSTIAETTESTCNKFQDDIKDLILNTESIPSRLESLEGNLSNAQNELGVLIAKTPPKPDTFEKHPELYQRLVKVERDFKDFQDMMDDRDDHIQKVVGEMKSIAERTEICNDGLGRLENQLGLAVGPSTRTETTKPRQNNHDHLSLHSAPLGDADKPPPSSMPNNNNTRIALDNRKGIHSGPLSGHTAVEPDVADEIALLRKGVANVNSHIEVMEEKVGNMVDSTNEAIDLFHDKLVSGVKHSQRTIIELQEVKSKLDEVVAEWRYERRTSSNPKALSH